MPPFISLAIGFEFVSNLGFDFLKRFGEPFNLPFEKSGHALFSEEREKFNPALLGFMAKAS